MKSWYSNSDDIEMKDGSKRIEWRVIKNGILSKMWGLLPGSLHIL